MEELKTKENKFRVWEPRHGVMVYPTVLQIFGGKADKVWAEGWKFSLDSEPDMVLMRFTGLTDKNGKEIYEGDIVRARSYGEEITFLWPDVMSKTGCGCHDGFGWPLPPETQTEDYEVIGNVHQHPGLLKLHLTG